MLSQRAGRLVTMLIRHWNLLTMRKSERRVSSIAQQLAKGTFRMRGKEITWKKGVRFNMYFQNVNNRDFFSSSYFSQTLFKIASVVALLIAEPFGIPLL